MQRKKKKIALGNQYNLCLFVNIETNRQTPTAKELGKEGALNPVLETKLLEQAPAFFVPNVLG